MRDCCRKTRPGHRCMQCGAPRWHDFRNSPERPVKAGIQPVRLPRALRNRHRTNSG